MKISFDLSKHCVQTEAKKIYEDCLRNYFKLDESQQGQMEEKIEALKDFLEQIDFGNLRSANPVLAGGQEKGAALLQVTGSGEFVVEVEGQAIIPKKTNI